MGEGLEGTVPVHAVADGLLLRRPEWHDAVAVRHTDPLDPDGLVWTFYGDAALVRSGGPEDPPLPFELARGGVHDPSLYLGTARRRAMGEFDWLSLSCEGAPEGGVNDS